MVFFAKQLLFRIDEKFKKIIFTDNIFLYKLKLFTFIKLITLSCIMYNNNYA